jgi:ABC-type branched-subunit amino acid transport system ATPase component
MKMEKKMLELRNICKAFGDVRVLDGVNLCLEKGFVYTLKGGNGSGKTTLINIISGFLKPDEGSVELKGEKIVRFLPFRVNLMNYNGSKKGNVTFVVIEHKRKLSRNIVNKEIELKLEIAGKLE